MAGRLEGKVAVIMAPFGQIGAAMAAIPAANGAIITATLPSNRPAMTSPRWINLLNMVHRLCLDSLQP